MERRVTGSTPSPLEPWRARALLAADPAGIIGDLGGSCHVELGELRRAADELVVPVVVQHRDGPLRHLVADLRLGARRQGSQLTLAGRYRWEPRHVRYGAGVLAHRAVHLLVEDLLTGTVRELEARAGG